MKHTGPVLALESIARAHEQVHDQIVGPLGPHREPAAGGGGARCGGAGKPRSRGAVRVAPGRGGSIVALPHPSAAVRHAVSSARRAAHALLANKDSHNKMLRAPLCCSF